MTSVARSEATEVQATGVERVELRYCQRCGALGIDRTAAAHEEANTRGCAACRQALQWLLPEVRR